MGSPVNPKLKNEEMETVSNRQRKFNIVLEYDGTEFFGWQRQKQTPTIQGEVEKALGTMTGQRVAVTGSGRTDAGVHARAQTAHFVCETNLTPKIFLKGLNGLLPQDIVVTDCRLAPEDFHARFSVRNKRYRYRILNRSLPSALDHRYAWHIRKKLCHRSMQTVLQTLAGTHDFRAFEGAGSPRSSTVRTVMRAALCEGPPGYLYFEVTANGFLRFMVRNIVGTVVDVGLGKTDIQEFEAIFRSRDRTRAGPTAPPQGLFLMAVTY
jgi:tRNA pseudouridine38-40 synthase